MPALRGTMREKQYGKIINVSSVFSIGKYRAIKYAASKAAVQGLVMHEKCCL